MVGTRRGKKRICETNHRWAHPLKLRLMSSPASSLTFPLLTSTTSPPPLRSFSYHGRASLFLPSPSKTAFREERPSISFSERMPRESAGATADYKLSSLPQNTARRLGGGEVGQSRGSDRHGEGGGFKTCWSLSVTWKLTGWETALYILSIFFSAVQAD